MPRTDIHTEAQIRQAIEILRRHRRVDDARAEIEIAWGKRCTSSCLAHAFAARGLNRPVEYLAPPLSGARVGQDRRVDGASGVGDAGAGVRVTEPRQSGGSAGNTSRVAQNAPVDPTSKLADLLKATRRAVSFSRLCDVLDMSPARVRHLVDDARDKGYSVNVAGDEIGWQEPEPAQDERTVLPATGERTVIGVISDTHFGSKYCLREYLRDFVTQAYDAGARLILHAGDMLDGIYDHGRWELSHHGLEEQIEDCVTTLPRIDGLRYCFIDGNHDSTFWRSTGYPTGRAIVDAAQREGRTDLEYVGARGALLSVGGTRVELWHPKKGTSYALSYHLQNKIRDTALGHKPDILLAGHWHTSVYVEQRGVHAFACGTFQGGGSEFSRSLGGAPSIGGWILDWQTTDHGTLRRLGMRRVSYYEHEQPREVA